MMLYCNCRGLSIASLLLLLVLLDTAGAFTPPNCSGHHHRWLPTSSASSSSSIGEPDTATVLTSSLKELLEGLKGEDAGMKLLQASSLSWRKAIYKALAAPDTAPMERVAKSLTAAMRKPDKNQFAILMGMAEPFEATFPSDPVINEDDNTAWVECRLRQPNTKNGDKLLVTMSISLVREDDRHHQGTPQWLISALDWQDFRDEFYPGLSGREWLRAF